MMLVRILLKFLGNSALVWGLAQYIPQYFAVTGGPVAWISIGLLLTILNILVRPILNILALPLKLFATILAVIIVNGLFVQLLYELTRYADSALVTLEIHGGFIGWSIVAIAFGMTNWFLKVIMK